jgi:hypothetical protein
MTRRTRFQRVRDALRRRKNTTEQPRTRISVAHWRRTHEVVHPERELSEWVRQRAVRDWDSVVKGLNDK